jgi:protein pelota
MKVKLDAQRRKAVVEPRSAEDLWRLSGLIEAGDIVSGRTERKVKVNEDTTVRKPVFLTLDVERAELQGDALRIMGTVREGTLDVPKGVHHTFNLVAHDTIAIEKEWLGWQLQKLSEEDGEKILLLLMDREEAVFALLRREPEILGTIKGAVQKKGLEQAGTPYWSELAKALIEYDSRLKPKHIVVASPAFFKEYVIRLLPAELAAKTVAATISATGEAALAELIRRPELREVLAQERYALEAGYVEELMNAIRQDKAAWGIDEVETQVNIGALKTVLVTTNHLTSAKANGTYGRTNNILKLAESMKAEVHVLDTSASQQVDQLGGITGVRRW